jgi:ribosomal protein S18 acetylase RimI-like enzyme
MRDYTFVARHDKTPVGVLLISPETYPASDKETAMLCYIAVDRRFRSKGVGKALVGRACSFLREKGKRAIEVDASVHNIPARIFYTKIGFYPYWFSRKYMPHDDGIFYRKDF